MVEKEMTRRRFLVMASGTVAAAVLAGCVRKEEIDTISAVVEEAAPTVEATNAPAATAESNPTAAPASPTAVPASPTAVPASPTATAAPTAQKNVRSACPRGLVNDPYPGKCKRYVDKNGNGICDLSEV
jgi:outer membrane murein-binding lipoprotein Lpp